MNRNHEAGHTPVHSEMERCVLCWRETDIPKDTPVSRRKYYLEGQGQLCAKCYYELYGAGVFRHTQGAEKLLAEWDTEKNAPLTPDDIHKGSHKKVWWRCGDGHIWKAAIFSRTGRQKCGCPICAGKLRQCTAYGHLAKLR